MPETEPVCFWELALCLIGLQILEIIIPQRSKPNGDQYVMRGLDLQAVVKKLQEYGNNNAVFFDSVEVNGNELAFRLTCGSASVIVRFGLAQGCAFDVVTKADLTKYPYAKYITPSKKVERTHMIFTFHDTDVVWVMNDCAAFRNMAHWFVFWNTDWHQKIWSGGPDPINYFPNWKVKMLAMLELKWDDIQSWSLAKFLTDKNLWNGVGAYNLSELLYTLWKYKNYHFWQPLSALTSFTSGSKILPTFFYELAASFRVQHRHISYFWKHFNLAEHNDQLLKDFALHQLQVYRRDGTRYFSFSGVGKRNHIYIWPHMMQAEAKLPVAEKWKEGKPKVWKKNQLGVGPISWSSGFEKNLLGTPSKQVQQYFKSLVADVEMDDEPDEINSVVEMMGFLNVECLDPAEPAFETEITENITNEATENQSNNNNQLNTTNVITHGGEKKKYQSKSKIKRSKTRPNPKKRRKAYHDLIIQAETTKLICDDTALIPLFTNSQPPPWRLQTLDELNNKL